MKSLKAIACLAMLAGCGTAEQVPMRSADFLEKKLGQDVPGTCANAKGCWNGTREESCTYGKCKSVCKDKEVKKEEGKNYCEAAATRVHVPVVDIPPGMVWQ